MKSRDPHRAANTAQSLLIDEMPSEPPPPWPQVDFVCNVCTHSNRAVALPRVQNRECPSCSTCGSSLRMRSIVHALGIELYRAPRALPDFKTDKRIRGRGMSDWDGYARLLADRFDYTNTYYHADPRLDITDVPSNEIGKYDFLISSDVFEHIPARRLPSAFVNARRLLRRNGFFLLTVPFEVHAATCEHFPDLHDFRIEQTQGGPVLYNQTVNGDRQVFTDLVFHGGEGATLEMRKFGKSDLIGHLMQAGFTSIRFCDDFAPESGICWPDGNDIPIVARRQTPFRRAVSRMRQLLTR